MKKLSVLKIAAALLILNGYMYTCGVMGTIGGEAMAQSENTGGTAEAVSPDAGADTLGEAEGQGTLDFLVPDETGTGYVELNLMEMAPISLAGREVQSTYSARSDAEELIQPEETDEILGPRETEDATLEPGTDEIVLPPPEEETEEAEVTTTPATTTTAKPVEVVQPTPEPEPEPEPAPEPEQEPEQGSEPEQSVTSTEPGIPVDGVPDIAGDDQPDEIEPQPSAEAQPEDNSEAVGEILYVRSNGGVVSGTALDIVGRITQNEIGYTFAPEAIKAQAVAAYTYVKFSNEYGTYPSVGLASTVSDSVRVLVQSVIGQAIYYNDSLIQSVYSASSAGYTASSLNVWGTEYPYLESRFCDLDSRYDPNYGKTAEYSSADIRSRVLEKTGIELTGDPSGWLEIEARVDGNYVGQMSVGGYHSYTDSSGNTVKFTGRVFRERVMSYDLRSSAFDVAYDPATDMFTFTTYGYGHGVGMSQNGANALATYLGYDYKQILTYYYQGTEIR